MIYKTCKDCKLEKTNLAIFKDDLTNEQVCSDCLTLRLHQRKGLNSKQSSELQKTGKCNK